MTMMFVTLVVKMIGVGIGLTLIVFGIMHYGRTKEALKTKEAEMEAARKAQEVERNNSQLSDAELRDSLRKWVRKK